MRKLVLVAAGALLVVSTAAYSAYGGWAVVKVQKVPDAWVAGKPLQLAWQVRQHGVHPLDGLEPKLEARSGTRVVTGTAAPYSEEGWTGYRGQIVFPAAGEWKVTIHSGFANARADLLPWRVVDSVTPVRGYVEAHLAKLGVPAFDDAERGRRLFVAQGCVTCHVHAAVGMPAQLRDFGPDLTDRHFAADYLRRFLTDPSIKPPTPGKPRMPNLELREKEILPLIAFINAERRAAAR